MCVCVCVCVCVCTKKMYLLISFRMSKQEPRLDRLLVNLCIITIIVVAAAVLVVCVMYM